MNLELLSELCETPGPSGREEPIRQVVRRELEPLAAEVSVDPLGNLVAVRPGRGGSRLMLSAHMDEIGFMVTHVDDAGFLRLITLGGFDPKTLTAQRAVVHGRDDLVGVMGSKPVHLMSDADKRRAPKLEDHVVDVGLPAERVRELALSGEGAAAGCVSIPTRYIHQVVETCHPADIDACVSLVMAVCETAQTLVEADLSRG